MILCNSGLVTQRLSQQLPRASVLTSLSFGITEPLQSFSCGYLRLKDHYTCPKEKPENWFSLEPGSPNVCFLCIMDNATL